MTHLASCLTLTGRPWATLGNFPLCKSFSAYYKILSLTYKALTTAQPGYLRNLISVDSPYGETRSSSSVSLPSLDHHLPL